LVVEGVFTKFVNTSRDDIFAKFVKKTLSETSARTKGTKVMIIFKTTKDTLKDRNAKSETIEHTDSFFSWDVNLFKLYGRKHYVFMNDFS
jgi:hypothetical protein